MMIFDGLIQFILNLLLPLGITEPVFQFMLIGAILGISIYLTLYSGMFSLANAGFMAIGAYISVILTQQAQMPLLPAIIIGMIVAGLVALPIGLPVLRLKDIYLAIATIGFSEIVRTFVLNFDNIVASIIGWLITLNEGWMTWFTTFAETSEWLEIRVRSNGIRVDFVLVEGARGIKGIPKLTETWMLLLMVVVLVIFLIRLHRSRFGRAMAAIRQDERVAANMGINVVYVKNLVFILSAMIAAMAGGLEGHLTRIVIPDAFGFSRNVDILAYAVMGGTQSWLGPIVGGLVLTALPEVLRFLKEYRGLINGLVLLGVIIYLPSGLVNIEGMKSLWAALRGKAKQGSA